MRQPSAAAGLADHHLGAGQAQLPGDGVNAACIDMAENRWGNILHLRCRRKMRQPEQKTGDGDPARPTRRPSNSAPQTAAMHAIPPLLRLATSRSRCVPRRMLSPLHFGGKQNFGARTQAMAIARASARAMRSRTTVCGSWSRCINSIVQRKAIVASPSVLSACAPSPRVRTSGVRIMAQ